MNQNFYWQPQLGNYLLEENCTMPKGATLFFKQNVLYCDSVPIMTWPEVIKLFSCSTQLSTKFILLINVKKDNNCWHFNIC